MSFQGTSDDQQDKIYINVGGKRHESYLSTLRNIPDTRLAWMAESIMNKQGEESTRKELFFDRHPDLFALILNYYRTGKLHAPRDVCGPLFQDELQFWGIEEMEMEACCWPNYTQHREAEKNLKDFVGPEFEEEDSEDDYCRERGNGNERDENTISLWQQYQPLIWAVLDDAFSSVKAKVFALVSLLMIVISVLIMCAASLPIIRNDSSRVEAFNNVEYFFCTWFTLELLLRLIFCPSKIAFFKQLMTWIDLISLMPYYSKIISKTNDIDYLRAVRLIRLFRAFRFFKFTSGLQIIVQSLKASFRELLLLVIILLIPVVLFSSIVFELEKKQQPIKFSSIPQTFWWAVITMTTVGYGDMAPKSATGQIIGSICAICGVLILGLPVSVIGNNFSTYYEHAQARLSLPKKKRRLIMGDANRLALMQGQSNSSEERDRQSGNVDLHTTDINDGGEQGLTRNYRRYHRRSRNTIFARGDVYIGQIKPKPSELSPPMEGNAEENEYGNGVVDHMERGDVSNDTGNSNNRNFTLISSTHESEEIIEEKLSKTTSPDNTWNNKSDDQNIPLKNSRSKVSNTSKSNSLELKDNGTSPPTARPSSTRSFRSRVSPTPEGCVESVAQPSNTRCNTSLTLPPLTITLPQLQESKTNDLYDVKNNSTYRGSRENVRADKNDDRFYRQEKPKRTRMHQNGDVSYG